MPTMTKPIPIEDKAAFIDLCSQLSPENLTCDGELSSAQVQTKRERLRAAWKSLEDKHGITVSETQAWRWWEEVDGWERSRSKDEHDRVLALAGTDQRLVAGNTGQWFRKITGEEACPTLDSPYMVYFIEHASAFYYDCSMAIHFGAERSSPAYKTLGEAADGADALLRTFTADRLKETRPSWSDQVVQRYLLMVPEALREANASPAP